MSNSHWVKIKAKLENNKDIIVLVKSTGLNSAEIKENAIYALYDLPQQWITANTLVITEIDARMLIKNDPSLSILNTQTPYNSNVTKLFLSQSISA